MNALDRRAVLALSRCTLLPATSAKRLARQWREKVERGEDVSPRGLAACWRLVWSYRRRLHDAEVLAEAERRHLADATDQEQGRLPLEVRDASR